MSRLAAFTSPAALLLVVTATVIAWNAAGHRLIAMLAYERMTEAARAEAVRILKKHPRFEKDFQGEISRPSQCP